MELSRTVTLLRILTLFAFEDKKEPFSFTEKFASFYFSLNLMTFI